MTFGFPRGFDIDEVAASAFARAGFGKTAGELIEFPYTDLSVKGGIRFAQHEFPHSPGSEIEKMGRKSYVITYTCPFHYLKGSELDKQYPELYPTKLRQLRELFEKEITGQLVVPTIGTIQAVATEWNQNFNVLTATGETVTLVFVEDQDATKAFDDQTLDYGVTQMIEQNDALLAAAALADFKSQNAISVFQQINDAITAVQAVAGQADAMSRLVEGKIRAVENLCGQADNLAEMQSPVNHLVLDALKDLWLTARETAENVIESKQALLKYRVPKLMSVGQISSTLYGSTEKSVEILQLNAFEDALAIPAGTLVTYLKAA